ncbi:hypothetical protein QYF61_027360, partial [Mycteria americana]
MPANPDFVLQPHRPPHGRAVGGNSPRPYQAREYPCDILHAGPREATDFPKRRVRLAYQTLGSLQKGVTHNYNPSFLPRGGGGKTRVPSATPHRTCSPDPSPALLPFSGHAPAINVLVVRGPKLDTVFEVWPHQCQVQGHDHFPSLAGHTVPDTSQDAVGFLGYLGTLPAHVQLAVNQHPQVLLHWAAFQPLLPKPVALHGVV